MTAEQQQGHRDGLDLGSWAIEPQGSVSRGVRENLVVGDR